MPARNFSKCYIMKIFALDEDGEEDENRFYIEATATDPKKPFCALKYNKEITKPLTIEDNDIGDDDSKDPNPLYDFVRAVGLDNISYEVLHSFSCENIDEFREVHQEYIVRHNPPVMPFMPAKFFAKHYLFYREFIRYQALEMLINERNERELLHSDD